jgi:pyridoxal phosphate enzyme (YggS family)
MTPSSVQENVLHVRQRITAAARRAGRLPEEITLIAVSKTQSADVIREAYDAGVRHFGENRVQEWEAKHGVVKDLPATWHLIGHLQSNKAARAAGLFHSVDSVHDFALARRLDHARVELAGLGQLRVLLEVRVEHEAEKSGVEITQLSELAEEMVKLPRLEFAGLMCIPPLFEDVEEVRPYFRRLRELRDVLRGQLSRALPVLSMGMSHDFEVAIEEGATEIRVGTALFGTRAVK